MRTIPLLLFRPRFGVLKELLAISWSSPHERAAWRVAVESDGGLRPRRRVAVLACSKPASGISRVVSSAAALGEVDAP